MNGGRWAGFSFGQKSHQNKLPAAPDASSLPSLQWQVSTPLLTGIQTMLSLPLPQRDQGTCGINANPSWTPYPHPLPANLLSPRPRKRHFSPSALPRRVLISFAQLTPNCVQTCKSSTFPSTRLVWPQAAGISEGDNNSICNYCCNF